MLHILNFPEFLLEVVEHFEKQALVIGKLKKLEAGKSSPGHAQQEIKETLRLTFPDSSKQVLELLGPMNLIRNPTL